MIKNFNSYILESRKYIDDLEMMNPTELVEILCAEVRMNTPDMQYIQDLIAVGCPIDARDKHGMNALHWAVDCDHLEVAKLLISMGADMHVMTDGGSTTWDIAADGIRDAFPELRAEFRKSIEGLEMLNPTELGELLCDEVREVPPDIQYIKDIIAVGCPIDIKDENDHTALYVATTYARSEVVKLLISLGADVNARDNVGWTALHRAANDRYFDIVKLLVSKGADVNARSNIGTTPCILAAMTGEVRLVKFLVSKGCDIDYKDNDGRTALMWAVRYEKLAVIDFLLSNGADIHARNRDGFSAWEFASMDGHIMKKFPQLNPYT